GTDTQRADAPPAEDRTRKGRVRETNEHGRARLRADEARPRIPAVPAPRSREGELGMDARLYRSQSAQALRVHEDRGARRGPSIEGVSPSSAPKQPRTLTRGIRIPERQVRNPNSSCGPDLPTIRADAILRFDNRYSDTLLGRAVKRHPRSLAAVATHRGFREARSRGGRGWPARE